VKITNRLEAQLSLIDIKIWTNRSRPNAVIASDRSSFYTPTSNHSKDGSTCWSSH